MTNPNPGENNPPPLPKTRPPSKSSLKKGILKGQLYDEMEVGIRTLINRKAMNDFHTVYLLMLLGTRGNYDVTRSKSGELDDSGLLLRNTKENEYVSAVIYD